jgi:hypothetical protein
MVAPKDKDGAKQRENRSQRETDGDDERVEIYERRVARSSITHHSSSRTYRA